MHNPIFLNRHTPPKIITLVMMAGLSALTMNIFLPSLPGMAAYFRGALLLDATLQWRCIWRFRHCCRSPSGRFQTAMAVALSCWAPWRCFFCWPTLGTLLATTALWFLIFRMAQAVGGSLHGAELPPAVVLFYFSPINLVVSDQNEAASMNVAYVTMGMSIQCR